MTRTKAITSLVGLALAGGLSACASGGAWSAADAGANASATAWRGASPRSVEVGVSNPTNGGPAYVGAGYVGTMGR